MPNGPFTVKEARAAGIERWHLRSQRWARLARGIYVPTEIAQTPLVLLEAAWRRLPDAAAFSGLTAAWLHGLDVAPCDPIEVTIPREAGVSGRAGMRVRRRPLSAGEVVHVRGLRATSIVRTLADLSRQLSLIEAVVIVDEALHKRRVTLVDIASLKRVAHHAEPQSASPMETRLRMILVLAGLPRPKAQVRIYDDNGRFIGRPDLYYEKQRLGIEYDGAGHRTTLAQDNQRQNQLLNAGVRLLRFTAVDVLQNPTWVVAQVRSALHSS
jgi:very-short-patch-repair endonuclease